MQLDQVPHQREPKTQPGSGSRRAALGLHVCVKHAGQHVTPDSYCRIAHSNQRSPGFPLYRNAYLAAVVREFRRIDQQVCKHLGQPPGIAVNYHGVRRQFDSQMVPVRDDERLRSLRCSPHDSFKVEQPALERDLVVCETLIPRSAIIATRSR